jgi:hypothetical protein
MRERRNVILGHSALPPMRVTLRASRPAAKNIFNTPIAFKWQSFIVRIVLD